MLPDYKSASDMANEMLYFKAMRQGYDGKDCNWDDRVLREAHANGKACRQQDIPLRFVYWGDDPDNGTDVKGVHLGPHELLVQVRGGRAVVYYVKDGVRTGVDFS